MALIGERSQPKNGVPQYLLSVVPISPLHLAEMNLRFTRAAK